eukprot:SAG31_NODE_3169_length_4591_cov_7.118655_3_plen_184_part_00
MCLNPMSGDSCVPDFSPEQCYPDTPFNTTKEPSTQDVNMAHDLPPLLRSIHPTPGYRSTCWVSCYCYLPTTLANGGIAALVASAGPKLRVFTQTVLLSAETVEAGSAAGDRARDGGGSQTTKISSVIAVQRTATPAGVAACPKHPGYGTQLSKSMPDWCESAERRPCAPLSLNFHLHNLHTFR